MGGAAAMDVTRGGGERLGRSDNEDGRGSGTLNGEDDPAASDLMRSGL